MVANFHFSKFPVTACLMTMRVGRRRMPLDNAPWLRCLLACQKHRLALSTHPIIQSHRPIPPSIPSSIPSSNPTIQSHYPSHHPIPSSNPIIHPIIQSHCPIPPSNPIIHPIIHLIIYPITLSNQTIYTIT